MRTSPYTRFMKECLNGRVKTVAVHGKSQPAKMKACAIEWRKRK